MGTIFDYPNRCSIVREQPVAEGHEGYDTPKTLPIPNIACMLDLGRKTTFVGGGKFESFAGEVTFPPTTDIKDDDCIIADDGKTYRIINLEGLRDVYGIVNEYHAFLGGV